MAPWLIWMRTRRLIFFLVRYEVATNFPSRVVPLVSSHFGFTKLTVFFPSLLRFNGFYWVLPSFTGFYWVLLGFTGFYWVLMGFTKFYWVLLGFTGFYLVLLGFTELYWVVPSLTGSYWVLLGFVLDLDGLIIGFTGFCWNGLSMLAAWNEERRRGGVAGRLESVAVGVETIERTARVSFIAVINFKCLNGCNQSVATSPFF